MIWMAAILVFGLFLAWANGANDNFKGVATLYGSKTASYKKALIWTTIATILGSMTALFFAQELIIVFKGKGLVPDEVMALKEFPVAVGLGAATTVMLATKFGLPVSTTHALIGALAGAGWIASSAGINFDKLMAKFFLPLIGGPLISFLLVLMIYPLFKFFKKKLGAKENTCLCVGSKVLHTQPGILRTVEEFRDSVEGSVSLPFISVGEEAYCRSSYSGRAFGISLGKILDGLHYLSGGLVSFSRGLNDTPKIAALLLLGSRFSLTFSILLVGIFMMVGGIVQSRKIAETMGNKLTEMNPGQAFSANLVTGIMVFGASRVGVPVSTTHVSCGSIFGIGAASKQAHWKVIGQVLLAWVTTLPLGALLGLMAMLLLQYFS
ncbi:inorganic phosphate transporter [Bacteriovoracaceae bacterium]|nr:inorganic phosphate transporter [Bacteriovoracaceae bacterium]